MKTAILGVAGLLWAAARLSAAQPLLGIGLSGAINQTSGGNSWLYRIDGYSNAPTAVVIGQTGVPFLTDVAVDPTTFKIYAIDGSPNIISFLYLLDPISGTNTLVGAVVADRLTALEFDCTGQAYAWGGNPPFLYRVNKQTGQGIPVGRTTNSVTGGDVFSGGDLAFDTNGVLYGASSSGLVIIDKDNGRVTWSTNSGRFYGLEIDTDGKMYAALPPNSGSTTTEIVSVNKTNGVIIPIGTLNFNFYTGDVLGGLSFSGSCLPPASPFTNTIHTAVEIAWKSETNRLYQVQWNTNVTSSNTWSNLGGLVTGNGSLAAGGPTTSVFDSTRTNSMRIYRVEALK